MTHSWIKAAEFQDTCICLIRISTSLQETVDKSVDYKRTKTVDTAAESAKHTTKVQEKHVHTHQTRVILHQVDRHKGLTNRTTTAVQAR